MWILTLKLDTNSKCNPVDDVWWKWYFCMLFNMVNGVSFSRVFSEEGINLCIVATIVRVCKAQGKSKMLEIVFVMFKLSLGHTARQALRRRENPWCLSELTDTDLKHNMPPPTE